MSRNDTIVLTAASALVLALLGGLSGEWTAVGLGTFLGLSGGLYGLLKVSEAIARAPGLNPTAAQNAVMGAIVGTFLGRAIVLGAGLILGVKVLGVAPAWIVISFFALYVIAQALEVRLALRTRSIQPAEGN
ncbi:MAG: hypothetical protein P1V51_15935 [Deltaproteobacteria bacterium]|nr:hypothetical protein [Deltaproteobacteria bacterium]